MEPWGQRRAWAKPQERPGLGRLSLVSIFPGSKKSGKEGEPLLEGDVGAEGWEMWGQRDGSQGES